MARGMVGLVCAYSSICEEDACWIDQYLAESDRLDMPFGMHFDRCSEKTKRRVIEHPNCVEYSMRDNPRIEFNEQHKQEILDRLVNRYYRGLGYSWAMAWDVDETYEKDAKQKIDQLKDLRWIVDYVQTRWLNLWGDKDHVRIDRHYGQGQRVKFYNLHAGSWVFDNPITNGCKLCSRPTKPVLKMDLVCLHWGMMTPELRKMHKERWDRIYGKSVGNNPYGFWNDALNEEITPVLEKHEYLP